jgi:hypothetical protein
VVHEILSKFVKTARDLCAKQVTHLGTGTRAMMSEDEIYAKTLHYYKTLNREQMIKETETIALQHPGLAESLAKAFYIYVIHFCGSEQNFLRVFETTRDGRVEIGVDGIRT